MQGHSNKVAVVVVFYAQNAANILLEQSKIEKVPRGIRGEKSSKDMASSRNLVSTIGALASPKIGTEPGVRKQNKLSVNLYYFCGKRLLQLTWYRVSLFFGLDKFLYFLCYLVIPFYQKNYKVIIIATLL